MRRMQASFLTDIFLPVVTILAMFGLGISLTVADFKQLFVHPKAVVVGLVNQLLLVPLTGILLALALPFSAELAIGLVIVAAAPGGTGSNITTYLLRGETALSISLTTVSNLLAFITLPLWTALALYIFTGTQEMVSISPAQIMLAVALVTLVPVGLGISIRTRWPQIIQYVQRPLRGLLALLLIAAIIAPFISEGRSLLTYLGQAGAAAVLLFFITFSLGFVSPWVFKLGLRTRLTIATESGVQNVPLALTVTATILANPLITITPAAFGMVQVFFFSIILLVAFGPWSLPLPDEQATTQTSCQ
jgi:BASS family bile acid:Na+ symporter